MNLLIVESPSKCKTIEKYLGKDYSVIASYGHIRDLVPKEGSVKTDANFDMLYNLTARKNVLDNLQKKAKEADVIYLATDPDREGEAISWHVLEVLKDKKIAKDKSIKRITFNQITKNAILDALKSPRDIDLNLVHAQEARRGLDYLVGFTLSPILWTKLKGCKSAGRVQSVALRLICERENEIDKFVKQEYWTIDGFFESDKGRLKSSLIEFDGQKIDKNINTQEQANEITAYLQSSSFKISNIETKDTQRNPYAPFITSTLQQDASSKLGFGAKKTMTLAQQLYESGLITYMRTDSPAISNEGISQIRRFIGSDLGEKYLSNSVRVYTSKAKNSQEAHEAIRPTDVNVKPEKSKLKGESLELYELIWKRAVASQCSSALFESTKIDISDTKQKATLRANGNVLKFNGFLSVYDYNESEDNLLPSLDYKDVINLKELKPEQHFTQPPPRYNEASLVKKMEELGIGRPSTYATIISILLEREYVRLEGKKLIPEKIGRVLVSFLEQFFAKYVEYDFTARLEDELDLISNGDLDKVSFLRSFWSGFYTNITEVKTKPAPEILQTMDNSLQDLMFTKDEQGNLIKSCPQCAGELRVKNGKFGPFVACSNYPNCNYILKTNQATEAPANQNQTLGKNDDGLEIYLKTGPYGLYVELEQKDSKAKPKRSSIPKAIKPEEVDLKLACNLLSLPKTLGKHPQTGEDVVAGIGKFGPYLLHAKKFTKLDPKLLFDLEAIDLNNLK